MAYGMSKLALEHLTVSLAAQLRPFDVAVNTFRIDVPVASEGFVANTPGADYSDWEPTEVAAEGIVWMLQQPPSYTGATPAWPRCEPSTGSWCRRQSARTGRHSHFVAEFAAPVPGLNPRDRTSDTLQTGMGSTRTPRDAQRSRVYLAETPLPSSPLPGLDASATFADRVVGTFWWQARFPEHTIDTVPRLRPGNGARQAFFRVDPDGPTITLPRRYRTKGVVLRRARALGHGGGRRPAPPRPHVRPHPARRDRGVLRARSCRCAGQRGTGTQGCTWPGRHDKAPTAAGNTAGTSGCASARGDGSGCIITRPAAA